MHVYVDTYVKTYTHKHRLRQTCPRPQSLMRLAFSKFPFCFTPKTLKVSLQFSVKKKKKMGKLNYVKKQKQSATMPHPSKTKASLLRHYKCNKHFFFNLYFLRKGGENPEWKGSELTFMSCTLRKG